MARLWKWISGYEGLYMISSEGDVLDVAGKRKRGETLSASIGKCGYSTVHLCKNGRSRTHNVHSLVATAFIPNPEGLREVDHINGDKSDNRIVNLEWVSSKENKRRAKSSGLWSPTWLGKKANNRKAVVMDGATLFDSITEASEALGITVSLISTVANGHRPHTHGHTFEFVK